VTAGGRCALRRPPAASFRSERALQRDGSDEVRLLIARCRSPRLASRGERVGRSISRRQLGVARVASHRGRRDRITHDRTRVHQQAELFNEIEATLEVTEAVGIEPELKATPLREEKPAGGKPGGTKLASHLPRVEIRHELSEAERQCGCGAVLAETGADVSEQLDYVPAKVQVGLAGAVSCGTWSVRTSCCSWVTGDRH
jgi:hypothetical protein